MPPLLRSFLQLLLVRDPARRAGWDELLRHEYIRDGGDEAEGAAGAVGGAEGAQR